MTVSVSFGMLGLFHELKERIIDRCTCSTRAILLISTIYICMSKVFYQLITLMAEDLIVSCCTEANNSGANEQGRNMVYSGPIDPHFLAVILIPEPHLTQNFDP